jgi:hypothetical protein
MRARRSLRTGGDECRGDGGNAESGSYHGFSRIAYRARPAASPVRRSGVALGVAVH